MSCAGWTSRDFRAYACLFAGASAIACSQAEPRVEAAEPAAIQSSILSLGEQQQVFASDYAPADYFGGNVAMSGDTALIAAQDDTNGEGSGAVYVFTRQGTTWSQQQKLLPTIGSANAYFGQAIAIEDDVAIIGARDDDNGTDSGAAYVFVRNAGVWEEQQKLLPSDGVRQDNFGSSVSISGDTAIVGADNYNADPIDAGADAGVALRLGAAYVFTRSGNMWTQQQKLVPTDPQRNRFGCEVALNGDTALIGAEYDETQGEEAGAVYAFTRSGSVWTQQQKLVPSGATAKLFGDSLALEGDTLLIGARADTSNGPFSGAAFVFTRSDNTWSQQQKLLPSDGDTGYFGVAVGLSLNTALVGAHFDDENGPNAGAAYVFTRTAGTWTQQLKILPADAQQSDLFGGSVSIEGSRTVIGAGGVDEDGNEVGAAYFGRLAHTDGSPCAVDSDCLSEYCVEGVCCNEPCNEDCRSCLASLQGSGGVDGTCNPVAEGSDPGDWCSEELPSSCGLSGMCDGNGECSLYDQSTECSPATCPTPTSEHPAHHCDGSGTCVSTTTAPCDVGYLCTSGGCATSCTSNDDCDTASHYLCLADECAKAPDGQNCSENSECDTGHCSDGVCCDLACNGQCEACAEPDNEGKCMAVTGAPRGTRTACAGDILVCGGMCNGADREECTYAPSTQVCDRSCGDGEQTTSTCDGQGSCVLGEPIGCGAYACAGNGCASECEGSDSDGGTVGCAQGYSCNGGQCLPADLQCSPDLKRTLRSNGTSTPCAPFLCDPAMGECRRTCDSSSHCAPGARCNSQGDCVATTTAAPADETDAGCSCKLAGRQSSPLPWLAALGLVGLMAMRRSRREEHKGS